VVLTLTGDLPGGDRRGSEESDEVKPQVTVHELLFGAASPPASEHAQNEDPDDVVTLFELLYGSPASPIAEPTMRPQEVDTAPALSSFPELQVTRQPKESTVQERGHPHLTVLGGRFVFWTWVRNIGIVVMLFVAWQLWGTSISQHHDQSQLHTAFETALQKHHIKGSASSGPTLIPSTQLVPSPSEGSVVARLQIPAIGVDQYVVSGTAENDLAEGPGHYIGTAMPGQAGNVAIAGHRTTHGAPFNSLGSLKVGDQIVMTTTSGEHLTYVVAQPPNAVPPSDVQVLNDFGDNRITLTTCNPEFSASQRLVVVGILKDPSAAKVPATNNHLVAYHVVNPATASWDWPLLPLVGLEVGLLLFLGLSNGRFTAWFGRSARWFILVPLWAFGLYEVFQTFSTFLPSTI
jgi:sortase A